MDKVDRCNSCGIRFVGRGSTSFPCPNCGDAVLGRCQQCRTQSVSYTCPECGFCGP